MSETDSNVVESFRIDKIAESEIKKHIVENPRIAGLLLGLMFLLSQAGNAAAAAGCTIGGP